MTAAQAAWGQIVNYMLFWQDYTRRALAGTKPGRGEVRRPNWEEPADASEPAWAQARRRVAQSCTAMRDAMRVGGQGLKRLIYHLPHESYHTGQIVYLRA